MDSAVAGPQNRSGISAPRPGPHVLVLGGGASGVLMAAHLLARPELAFRVTLVEGKNRPGQGIAYSTAEPDHLLNTRVHNMSAWPDDPAHFLRWLLARPDQDGVTDACFISRAAYGAYLTDLLTPWAEDGWAEESTAFSPDGSAPAAHPAPNPSTPEQGRLRFLHATCLNVTEDEGGVSASLSDGRHLRGDIAVLATGHVLPEPDPQGLLHNAWGPPRGLDPEAKVAILGTGLSMVDQVLSLLKQGHIGPILAISRRGLLPRAHTASHALTIAAAEVPFGAPLHQLMRWLRTEIQKAEAKGASWRDVVDGVRVHVQALWRALPPQEKLRFLRHGATWWDVHRHRIPPASAAIVEGALRSGQLTVVKAGYSGAARQSDGSAGLRLKLSGGQGVQTLPVDHILDCRGIRRDPNRNALPPIAGLLDHGAARIDPLAIGLDVTDSCQVVDQTGRASSRLYAIGPVSRAAFWEITAIPDIRVQTQALAQRLAKAQV